MNPIPEIRIRSGKVVEPETGRLIEPVPLLRSLESALSTDEEDALFYVIDEDGMARNSFDMDLLERLGEEFRIWFKGGFRKADFLMDALILGAEMAVMDSSTVLSMDEVRKATEMSDSIGFSVEMREYPRWNDVPSDIHALSSALNSMRLNAVVFSCESPKDIRTDLFNARKFIHGCGEKEGVEGIIVPYTLIPLRRE